MTQITLWKREQTIFRWLITCIKRLFSVKKLFRGFIHIASRLRRAIAQRYQFDINIYLIILHICVSSGIRVILKIQWIRYKYNKKVRILIWIALAFCKRVLSNVFWVCSCFSWHPILYVNIQTKKYWVVLRWIDHNTHIDR